MSEVKTANPGGQLHAVPGRGALRFGGDFAHSGRDDRRIAALAFNALSFDARGQDLRKVRPRQ